MNEEQQLTYNKLISKNNFNEDQKDEIRIGLEKELDVNWYAKPEYTWQKMSEIRWGWKVI